jgi:hypothetical protein
MPERYISAHFSGTNERFNPLKALWLREERKLEGFPKNRTYCRVRINIPEDLNPTISFFYHLENFYQNHRRYVNSFNARQLLGDAVDGRTINESTCDPITYDPKVSGKIVYPCGLVANSIFNDTFSDLMPVDASTDTAVREQAYVMSNTGIAWPGAKDLYGLTQYSRDQIVPPPNWEDRYPDGYTEKHPVPDLKLDEHFQNWMMLAATPNFYKLYQKNDSAVLRAGQYEIEIESNFDTIVYNGRKAFVITTISALGSRNIWPGIIFLIVGGICLLLDVYFILSFFLWKPRKLGDPSYLSWNQPSAAQGHAASS